MIGKKTASIILAIILVSLAGVSFSAHADVSADITSLCQIGGTYSKNKLSSLTDRNLDTIWLSEKEKTIFLSIETPSGQACFGIYFCSATKEIYPFSIQIKDKGEWKTVGSTQGRFAHEYMSVDGLTSFRIISSIGSNSSICLSEIYILGSGTIPSWVQQWTPAPDRLDLMVLAAHPDDELLFFGGTLPYYGGELKKNIMVAFMTCNTIERRSELLNSLWACGIRIYPDIGDFYDKFSNKLDTGYSVWGKTKTMQYITALIRRYKPDVVLSHDINGEYGHGAHRVCADAVQKCVAFASDQEKYPNSVRDYGTWQVKKLYLHLYSSNGIKMEWDAPLSVFGDLTGYEVAAKAYLEYKTQANASKKNKLTGEYEKFIVEPQNSPLSSYDFGLVFSAVGPDKDKKDFFENIR